MKTLEDTISHVVNVFLDVADQAMQSPWARQDKALMEKLSKSIHSIMSAVSDSGEPEVQPGELELEATRPSHNFSSAMDLLWTQPVMDHEQPQQLPQQAENYMGHVASSATSTSHYGNEMAQDPKLQINIFGNGLIFKLGPDNLFASINEVKPRLDNSLGVFLTHLAVYRGYQALLRDKDVVSPRLRLAFGLSLTVFSRDELLRMLRYILGPGSSRIERLATVSLNRCYEYITQNSVVPDHIRDYFTDLGTSESFVNSDELAKLIEEKTLGQMDGETFDMMVAAKPLASESSAPMLRENESVDWGRGDAMTLEDDFSMRLVRVSKSKLFDFIAMSGICLGQGPLFRKSDLDGFILAAEVTTM
jgi:hypothetical protein